MLLKKRPLVPIMIKPNCRWENMFVSDVLSRAEKPVKHAAQHMSTLAIHIMVAGDRVGTEGSENCFAKKRSV